MTFRLWKWRPDFKSDPDCSCQDCVAYRNGIFEPNYPMPAVIYEVCLDAEFVAVLERGTNVPEGYRVHPHIYPDWITEL